MLNMGEMNVAGVIGAHALKAILVLYMSLLYSLYLLLKNIITVVMVFYIILLIANNI